MRECANIVLKNGFHLAVIVEELPGVGSMVSVVTMDEDDTFNQDLVKVYIHDSYKGEKFDIDLYLNPDDGNSSERFEIKLHHDNPDADGPNDGTDDEDEDDYDEYYDVEQEDFTDVDKSLFYGCTGEEVKEIQRQLKKLGYFNGTIGGNYLAKTQAAVEAFQKDNGLEVTGICDNTTYDKMFSDEVSIPETATETGGKRHAINADWWTSDIQQVFAKGVTAKITDVETGLTWQEQRRGGTNHADVQPLTKADTANLKKAYGGKWAWTRRAIWVTIGDKTYAASMNGMPHGGSSISGNDFPGHHCIHAKNSRTHGTNRVDENHQKMVKKAAETPLPDGL